MEKLKIITSTTRPGANGIKIANWVESFAKKQATFEVELLDLAKIGLPFMDEPEHPRLQRYQHEHTKQWSEKIAQADAFVIVLSEYNHGYPAPVKNAIDYLVKEWAHKPVGLVTYGGISGGLRSAALLKPILTALNMMPVSEGVTLPFFTKFITEQGTFKPDEHVERSTDLMLHELERWSKTLKGMRTS